MRKTVTKVLGDSYIGKITETWKESKIELDGRLQIVHLVVEAAEHDMGAVVLLAQCVGELYAVHAGHLHVADQHIRLKIVHGLERFVAVFAHADDAQRQIIEGSDHVDEILPVVCKIVHHQNTVQSESPLCTIL